MQWKFSAKTYNGKKLLIFILFNIQLLLDCFFFLQFEVLILAAEGGSYGVIPVELNGAFEKIQRSLLKLKMKNKLPAVEKPVVNFIYAEWANVM